MAVNAAEMTEAKTGTVWWSRGLARHYLEMVVAMIVGMAVFGGLFAGAVALLGLDVELSPTVAALKMAVDMALGMVVWMRYRGHDKPRSAEMAASMMVPTIIAAALGGAGALGSAAALGVQHVVMIPAMLGVMLWRYDHYARPH